MNALVEKELAEVVLESFLKEFEVETNNHPDIILPMLRRVLVTIMAEGHTLEDMVEFMDGEISKENLVKLLKN